MDMQIKFQGEQMTCVICGKKQMSNPYFPSDWRFIRLPQKTTGYYVCPTHFPSDNASATQFERAYAYVFRYLAELP